MASFTAGTTFVDGVSNDVTAAKLGNLVTNATPTSGFIQDRTAETVTATNDTLLIGDASDSNNLKRITVANFAQTLPTAKVTTGTIETGTFGTTTSTAATITTGTITTGVIPTLTTGTTTSTNAIVTNGTVQTLTASTANISQGSAILTQGTIATLNSTTGTITNLSATTSTFLGAITASTNTIAIGSVQFCKDANGNVGIGESVPSSKFEVRSGGGSNAGAKATYEGAIKINETGLTTLQSTGGIEFKGSIFGSGYGSKILGADDGQLLIGNRSNSASWTERMRIDGSGNVSIGTATALSRLHVHGDVTLSNTTTATTAATGGVSKPATYAGFLTVSINGTSRKIPYYA
jgi:hypothetical protein